MLGLPSRLASIIRRHDHMLHVPACVTLSVAKRVIASLMGWLLRAEVFGLVSTGV